MIEDIQALVDGYHKWLKEKTTLRPVDGWVEITSPMLDRHNDHLQMFAKQDGSHIVLTDDGYILRDLETSGCNLDTPKRQELLRTTLNGFGVELDGDKSLKVKASLQDFPRRKHNLIQAMLAVNDLFYVAQPHVISLFKEDVQAWLDLSDVRYTPSVNLRGKSGYEHLYDFVVPANQRTRQPERIVEAIARPNRDSAFNFIYSWMDTREARPQETMAHVLLNDQESNVPVAVLDAFANYDIRSTPWSKRDQLVARLQ